MKEYFKIISDFKLKDYFAIVFHKSTSNGVPYHNMYHVMCMVRNCFIIASALEIHKKEIKNLLIAALFHDFNHSGGKLKDSENVKNAILAFEEHSKQPKEDNLKIIEIIKATEYPYVISEDKLNIYQKIIRDADLLQSFEDNYIQQITIGLGMQEMGLDVKSILIGQENFLKNIKFHTFPAKMEYSAKMPGLLKDLEFLKNSLL